MAVQVVHSTVATLPDEPGAEINKAEWNAAHTVTGLGTAATANTGDFEAAGAVAAGIATHVGLADPHAQYALESALATVATTGVYADLSGKPTLGTAAATAATDYLPIGGGTLTGALLFTDNSFDIGASSATRPRTLYWGTQLLGPDGSLTFPAFSFASQTNVGFRKSAANEMEYVIGGNRVATYGLASLVFRNTWQASNYTISLGSAGAGNLDRAGMGFIVAAGQGTGAGAAATVAFQTPTALTSGSTLQALSTRLTIGENLTATGSTVVAGLNTAALNSGAKDITITAAYGTYVPDEYEIATGQFVELSAGAVMEIG